MGSSTPLPHELQVPKAPCPPILHFSVIHASLPLLWFDPQTLSIPIQVPKSLGHAFSAQEIYTISVCSLFILNIVVVHSCSLLFVFAFVRNVQPD